MKLGSFVVAFVQYSVCHRQSIIAPSLTESGQWFSVVFCVIIYVILTTLCSASYVSWAWHCSRLLLITGHAAISWYLLAARPTAANLPQWHTVAQWWDRQTTNAHQFHRPHFAYYASSVSNVIHLYLWSDNDVKIPFSADISRFCWNIICTAIIPITATY